VLDFYYTLMLSSVSLYVSMTFFVSNNLSTFLLSDLSDSMDCGILCSKVLILQ